MRDRDHDSDREPHALVAERAEPAAAEHGDRLGRRRNRCRSRRDLRGAAGRQGRHRPPARRLSLFGCGRTCLRASSALRWRCAISSGAMSTLSSAPSSGGANSDGPPSRSPPSAAGERLDSACGVRRGLCSAQMLADIIPPPGGARGSGSTRAVSAMRLGRRPTQSEMAVLSRFCGKLSGAAGGRRRRV